MLTKQNKDVIINISNEGNIQRLKENREMKKLNREDYTVIDEFDCNITTIVNVFEEQSGKLIVIDEFGLDITKRVKVIRK